METMETLQEKEEREQQAKEERMNGQEKANGHSGRVNWSEPVNVDGNLVFPGGEMLERRENALVIMLPKGRKPHPIEFKQDEKTGKWIVPKSRVYTYFAYNLGDAANPIRLAVTLTTPIPFPKRQQMFDMLVGKGLKVEPIEQERGRRRLTLDDVAGLADKGSAAI